MVVLARATGSLPLLRRVPPFYTSENIFSNKKYSRDDTGGVLLSFEHTTAFRPPSSMDR